MQPFLSCVLNLAAVLLINLFDNAYATTSETLVVITKASSSCTRPLHTVYVYTSDSSTYIVQDLGSASLCSSTRLFALGSSSASLSRTSDSNAAPLSFPDATSSSHTLWCAPTTITAPGPCPDTTLGGTNGVYERTITSYIAAPDGSDGSCVSLATVTAPCPASTGDEAQVYTRIITSQMPAMTSYVYRSLSGPPVVSTTGTISDFEQLSEFTQRDTSSSSYVVASPRTVTSLVYVGANSSCSSTANFRERTLTSYIYAVNTTITVQADGSACESIAPDSSDPPRIDSSSTGSSSLLPDSSRSSNGIITVNTPGSITLTISEGGVIFTTTERFTQTTTETAGLRTSDAIASSAPDNTVAGPSASPLNLQSTPTPVTANASALQQQGVGSDPYVSAQVVNPQDDPPIVKPGDNDFLLITFGSTSAASSLTPSQRDLSKRQAAQPLVYNTTHYFQSVAGGIYNLTAVAANAQNGKAPPNCALSICADGPAYVGLDNVTVTPTYLPPAPASSGALSTTAQVIASPSNGVPPSWSRQPPRTVTTSVLETVYVTLSASTVTVTASPQTITLSTQDVSTAPGYNVTVSGPFQTETTILLITSILPPRTSYVVSTSIQPASTVYTFSSVAASTQYLTFTTFSDRYITETSVLPASSYIITSVLPASTRYITETSTLSASSYVVTSTLHASPSIPNRDLETTTIYQISTERLTTILTNTQIEAGTNITQTLTYTKSLPAAPETISYGITQPRDTDFLISTIRETLTTQGSAADSLQVSAAQAETQTLVFTSLEYSLQVSTVPASTIISTYEITYTSFRDQVTETLREGSALSRESETLWYTAIESSVVVSTMPASTVYDVREITYTSLLPQATVTLQPETQTLLFPTIEYLLITVTIGPSTIVSTQEITYTTREVERSISVFEVIRTTSLEPHTVTNELPASTDVSMVERTYTTSVAPIFLTETTQLPPQTSLIVQTTTEQSIVPASTITSILELTRTTFIERATATETTSLAAETTVLVLTTTATSVRPASTIVSTVELTRTTSLPQRTVWSSYGFTETTSIFGPTETTRLPGHTSTIVLTGIAPTLTTTKLSVPAASTAYITLTSIRDGSTIYITSTLPRATDTLLQTTTELSVPTASTAYITLTSVRDGSTIFITSTLPRATDTLFETTTALSRVVSSDIITLTSFRDGSTIYVTSTRPPETFTAVSTVISSQVITSTLEPAISTQVFTTTAPGQTSLIVQTTTLSGQVSTYVSVLPTTAFVTYTSVRDGSTSYFTETRTLPQATTTAVSIQPASTLVSTQYTTIQASTIASTIYSTIQTTNVVTQYLTLPASSIYVTYTTTIQGQAATVTMTYTPTTSTPQPTSYSPLPTSAPITTSTTTTTTSSSSSGSSSRAFSPTSTTITTTSTTRTTTTTTTTSSSARAASSSSSIIRPPVALRAPTVIVGSTTSAPANVDDATYAVTIPVPITIMGTSSTRVNVSSNGILAIGALTTAYANAPLPQYAVAPVAVFACWDDLYIFQGTPQGIYYAIDDGAVGRRGTTFEFYEAQYQGSTLYYHFLVSFWENLPNIVTIDYLNMTNNGSGATVGIESQTANKYNQYSHNQGILTAGVMITYDYSSNTWSNGFPPGISSIPGAIYW